MCYDISYTETIEKIVQTLPEVINDLQLTLDFDKGVHIMGHGYPEHPVIYRNKDDHKLHSTLMEWGCIPYYIKDEDAFRKQRASMLNIRSERILADTKSYWNKIKNRRCLIPVTGFYEHREVKGIKNKIPYLVSLKEQPLFFLPGLYSVAEVVDKKSGELQKRWTFAIITRNANSIMRQIHNSGDNANRMPLMLPFNFACKWMNEELSNNEYQQLLDYEMSSDAINYKTVYTIRSARQRPDNKAKNEFYEWNVRELDAGS